MMTLVQSDPVSTLVLVAEDFWNRTREALQLSLWTVFDLLKRFSQQLNWSPTNPLKWLRTHHLNHPVEKSILPDGDEALHLPGELEGSFTRDNSLVVKEGRSGSSVHFNIFPGESEWEWSSVKFVLNPSFARCPNLLVAAETVGGYTGVVAEVLVLDVCQSEAVLAACLLHRDLGPGTQLSLLEEPGGAGLRLPGHQAVDEDRTAGPAGNTLSLHSDDRAVWREEEGVTAVTTLATLRWLTLDHQGAAGRVRLAHPVVGGAEVAARVRPGHAGDVEAGVGRAGAVGAGGERGVRPRPDHGRSGVARHLALQHHLLTLSHPHLQHRLHTGGHWNQNK